jgi:hypothetical protein
MYLYTYCREQKKNLLSKSFFDIMENGKMLRCKMVVKIITYHHVV